MAMRFGGASFLAVCSCAATPTVVRKIAATNAAIITRELNFMVISAPDGRKEYHSKRGRVGVAAAGRKAPQKKQRANRSQVRLALLFMCSGLGLSGPVRVSSGKTKPRHRKRPRSIPQPAPDYCAAASEPGRRSGRPARSSTESAPRLTIETSGWLLLV